MSLPATGSLPRPTLLDIYQQGQGELRLKIFEYLRPSEQNDTAMTNHTFRRECLGELVNKSETQRRAFLKQQSIESKAADRERILESQKPILDAFFATQAVRPLPDDNMPNERNGLDKEPSNFQKEFKDGLFPITGHRLSDKDFGEMVVFYRTDAGKKLLKIQVSKQRNPYEQNPEQPVLNLLLAPAHPERPWREPVNRQETPRRAFPKQQSIESKAADRERILESQKPILDVFFANYRAPVEQRLPADDIPDELNSFIRRNLYTSHAEHFQREFKDRLFPITGDELSGEDFKAMVVFYKTDAGKKLLKIQVFKQINQYEQSLEQPVWSWILRPIRLNELGNAEPVADPTQPDQIESKRSYIRI